MSNDLIDEIPPISVVIAEDDEDDYMLTMEAFKEANVKIDVVWVKDGEELMDYLSTTRAALGKGNAVTPGLILLDLNMPKKDGREALQEIKDNSEFRKIPVVILTTSKADFDIAHTYDLGVNSFIQKPVRFSEFVNVIKVFTHYWFHIVSLPR